MHDGFALRIKHEGMAVPYARDHDGKSHSYVDLRADPSVIGTLPETQGWPEICDCLREINSEKSIFRTIGCEKYLQQVPEGYWVLVGYVGFGFTDLNVAAHGIPYFIVFQTYCDHFRNNPAEGVSISFEMIPTNYILEKRSVWTVDWWMRSTADTAPACRGRWCEALESMSTRLSQFTLEDFFQHT